MILYNIRANGPFEYDKFILNIGQLHNMCLEAEKQYQDSCIKKDFNTMLDEHICDYVLPKESYNNPIYDRWMWQKEKRTESWLNQLSATRKAVLL